MKVCTCCPGFCKILCLYSTSVDYILFMTADVSVTPNENEIRAHKYVDKAELQAMFDESGKLTE
jgi:isopentenyldiphosphate isomerase